MGIGLNDLENLRCLLCSLKTSVEQVVTPLRLISRTLEDGDGAITLGSVTSGADARGLVFLLPVGQQIQLTDPVAMSTAIFDNSLGAAPITLTFSPGCPIPSSWTLLATIASPATVSIFY
jgi:hypothetical protein